MVKSVLAHIQTLREVFNDDSMEGEYQQLLPTISEICVLRFLIGVLQPFAEATDILEGESYLTSNVAHVLITKLRRDVSSGFVHVHRDGAQECVPLSLVSLLLHFTELFEVVVNRKRADPLTALDPRQSRVRHYGAHLKATALQNTNL